MKEIIWKRDKARETSLDMVLRFEENKLSISGLTTPSRKNVRKQRNFTSIEYTHLVWCTLWCLQKGMDITKICSYMHLERSPLFHGTIDARILRNKMKRLCCEEDSRELETYCGYYTVLAKDNSHSVTEFANALRASFPVCKSLCVSY